MKLLPMILSVLLAGSALGYGMQASAQMAGAGGGTPCSASFPCAQICGDHPCAPGEVYTPGMTSSNASATKAVSQNTNQTGVPSIATQMGVSANVTVTKIANGTNTVNGTSTQENIVMGANATVTKSSNGTMTGSMSSGSISTPSNLPSPRAQVTAGAQPTNVKCISGFYLMISNSDSRPACVTQSTMLLLEARGWGQGAP
ncbi:MAG: hypothetical protein ACREA7_07585 [Nitrosotalea sp.]